MPYPKPIQMRKGEFTHDLLHLRYSTVFYSLFQMLVDASRAIDHGRHQSHVIPLRICFEISAVPNTACDWSTDSTQGIMGLISAHA